MSNSNAIATRTRHHRADVRRLPRKTAVVSIAAALTLVAGVAFALYLLNAKVSGTATTRTADYTWSSSGLAGTGTAAVCTPDIPTTGNGNSLNLTVSGYPGDTCTVTASVALTSAENFRVTGVNLTGLPTGWTSAVTGANCGKTVQPSQTTPVTFTVTIGANSTGSGTIGGGLSLSPVSQTGTGALTCS